MKVTNFPKPVRGAGNTWVATINVRVNTSPMMGSLVGATYTWQIQIIRNNTIQLDWTKPSTTLSANSGTIVQTGLDPEDIINIRCLVNTSLISLATNSILDRGCSVMNSSLTQILVPTLKVLQSPTVASSLASENTTAAISKNQAAQTASASTTTLPEFLAEQSVISRK